MKINSVCLTAHPFREVPQGLAKKIIECFRAFGISIYVEPWLNALFDHAFTSIELADIHCCDAIVVLGGDGTLLHMVPWAVKADIPMLAINAGRLGFLTEVEQDELDKALEAFCKGEYSIDERMLLQAQYGKGETQIALNDIVVSRGTYSKLITMNAYISDDLVGRYIGDGIIVSSPTGSTGYSLSAGGPIISPKLKCMVITPICPHSLQHRPVVVGAQEVVHLELLCEADVPLLLIADGHEPVNLNHNDIVKVTRSNQTVKLIRLRPLAFFSLVRKKLLEWSQ